MAHDQPCELRVSLKLCARQERLRPIDTHSDEISERKEDHMKILTLLSIGSVIGLTGCSLISTTAKVKGSGILKNEKRSLASFDSLDVGCHGSIQVRSQAQRSLEINGDDNIIPLITTEVRNNTLYI